MKRLMNLKLVATLSLVSVGGCQCTDDLDFFNQPDAGVPDVVVPPPPPVFPLKAGDILQLPAVQGRTEPCTPEGSCQRAVRATYTITDTVLDEDEGRWSVEADYLYEIFDTGDNTVPANDIGQLFVIGAVPFELTAGSSDAGSATFNTDEAPIDGMRANDFPFFHFEPQYATQPGSAYQTASATFRDRILDLDPEADVENQAAEGKFEAYFRDTRGASPQLHHIRVDLHPFGFVCAFDERLIPFEDGMARNENSFAQAGVPPLAGSVSQPIRLTRGDVRYRCQCGNLESRQCIDTNDSTSCLDPEDPDGPPIACP